MKKITLLAITSTVLALGAMQLMAGDWPQWRGSNRDGICTETGLLKEWPAGGPPLAFKIKGIGKGYGTVAVAQGHIFVQGDIEDSAGVTCLNVSDGSKVWASKFGKAGAPGWGGFAGARCTPTVDADLVYAIGQFGQVVCAESATGKILWQKDYEKDFGGVRPEWGFAASPVIDGERLILAPGGAEGNLVALNKKTGELMWRSKGYTDTPHYDTPLPVDIGGAGQYLQLTEKSLAGIAAKDGALLWKAPRKGSTAVIPDPIYRDGFVYVTSGYGAGCNLFKVTAADGKFSAEQVYASKVIVNHHGGVVLIGDNIYGHSDSKGWTCQNFKTGEAVWQEKSKLGKGSILGLDGNLILREEDEKKGAVALIAASPAGYKELGRFIPPEQSGLKNWPHPVVSGGMLYLRDQDTLLCYNLKAK